EVDDLLGMTECEHAVRAVGLAVPGVVARRRVTTAQRHLHVVVALNRSAEATVADGEELAVPIGARHPQFGVDVRITGWLEHQLDAAVRRDRLRRCASSGSLRSRRWCGGAAPTWLHERARGDCLGADNGDVGNWDAL